MAILERLKEETRELHEAIESSLPVMRPDYSLPQYRQLLARFYGFYLPVERELDRLSQLEPALPDWPKRRKMPSLLRDLHCLNYTGQEIANLPFCRNLPSFSTISESFGCLYVLEGSTLGGQIITRHLHALLGIRADCGGAFFHSYGPHAGAMWQAFRDALTSVIPLAEQDRTVRAARHTFYCLHEWLSTGSEIAPAETSTVNSN